MKGRFTIFTVLALALVFALCAAPVAAEAKNLTVGMSWAHKNDSLFYAMDDTLATAMAAMASSRGYDKVE
jgi:ABC-type sugar transport system substrate-binding protein